MVVCYSNFLCMKLYLTICAFFLVGVGHAQLSGAYTIGGTAPNYGTINAAVNALIAQGVNGPVTFNIRPGIYTEYLSFSGDNISGLSWTNTVTFQSETRDSGSVQLSYPNTDEAFDYYTLVGIQHAHHLIFRFISFTRTGSDPSASGNHLVRLSEANHIAFEHCSFEGSADLSDLSGIGIHISDGGSNIKVDNCYFNAMESCFYSECVPTDASISIQNSVFSNFRQTAITVIYLSDSLEIKNNYFTNDSIGLPDQQMEETRAIGITNCQGVIEVMRNRIEGRYALAMYVSCMNGTPAYLVKIYNNFISVGNLATPYGVGGASSAIQLSNDSYVDIQYNSINLYATLFGTDNQFCGAAVGLGTPANNHIRFINNLIQADSLDEYFAFGLDYTGTFSQLDHNNYYNTNGYAIPVSYVAEWPESWNTNSTAINPMFYSRNDLHVQNPELAVAMPTLVTEDIDGNIRVHPSCVGADDGSFLSVPTTTKNEYGIYPNPTNDVLHVVTDSEEWVPYRITDVNGKLIQNGQVSSSSNVIVLKDLGTGIYSISFSNSGSATRFVRF